MSAEDQIPCDVQKIREGDVDPNRPISECLLRKFGQNINAFIEAWKLDCKEFNNGDTFTTPEIFFGAFAVASEVTSGFQLNQVGGNIVSFAGSNGFTVLENLNANTSYPVTTSGKITIVCLGCDL